MFLEQDIDPDEYIIFNILQYNLKGAILYNENLLYCQNKEKNCYIRQKSKGEEYLGSFKDIFNDNDHTIAYFYTDSRCPFRVFKENSN